MRLRSVKVEGCKSDKGAGVVVEVASRYYGGDRRKLTIHPLAIECPYCAAAPGWGCYARHNRKVAAELEREVTPLCCSTGSPGYHEVAYQRVHGSRWHGSIAIARKLHPEEERRRHIVRVSRSCKRMISELQGRPLGYDLARAIEQSVARDYDLMRAGDEPGEFDIISEEAAP